LGEQLPPSDPCVYLPVSFICFIGNIAVTTYNCSVDYDAKEGALAHCIRAGRGAKNTFGGAAADFTVHIAKGSC